MVDKRITMEVDLRAKSSEVKKAKKDVDALADSTDKLGDELKETSKDAKSFDEQLKELTRQRAEYAKKGLASEGDERKAHLKRYNAISREIGLLKKLKSVTEEHEKGSFLSFRGYGIPSLSLSHAMPAPGVLIAAAAPIAFALASAVGAALSGAVAGATVAAGVAGGILAASKSAEVRAAAKDLGGTISSEFFGAGSSFVKPTTEALHILAGDFKSLNLSAVFERAAPAVTILAHGVGDLVKGIMPGFNRLLDRSAPIAGAFADGLANVGDALGDMLTDIADSKGTLTGLRFLMDSISGTIRGLGATLGWLGDRWYEMSVSGAEISGALEDIVGWLPGLGDYMAWVNDNFERWSGTGEGFVQTMHEANTEAGRLATQTRLAGIAAQTAAERTKNYNDWMTRLNDEMKEASDRQADYYEAQLAANDGLRQLREQLAEAPGQWNSNTEAGNRNLSMLTQQIEKAQQVRDAQIEMGDGTAESQRKAQKEYNKTVDQLLAIARQAGLTESQLKKLEGIYRVTVVAEVIGQQAVDWSKLRNAERKAEGRASGGPILAGVPYMINERARETVTFPANGMVHSANLSPMSSGTVRHVVDLRINGRTIRELLIEDGLSRGKTSVHLATVYP